MTTTPTKPQLAIPKLKKFQEEPTEELYQCLKDISSKQGRLVIGSTGCGKTFIMAAAIRKAQDDGLFLIDTDNKPFQLNTILILGPKNSIPQQQRVLNRFGVKGAEVISANALSSSYGEMFITWEDKIDIRGEVDRIPIWHKESMPDVIFIDECQMFKNYSSNRVKVLLAYLRAGGKIILISATPFQKASETKLIALGCKLIFQEEEFNRFSWEMAGNSAPTDNSPATVNRIKKALEARGALINIKNVRYPFKPIITNIAVECPPEKKVLATKFYNAFMEERRKHKNDPQGIFAKWLAMLKYREAMEYLKVDELADFAIKRYRIAEQQGTPISCIVASNFINTLSKFWELLGKAGIDPKLISHLVGNQTDSQRLSNIDNFQEGKTRWFLTTLKSGGCSLNLNHNITTSFPREVFLPPTWSVYEMVQVLGRAQRIDNLSQVTQHILWYAGTIEEKVKMRLDSKMNCLKELLDRKDSFIHDVFEGETETIEKLTEKFEEEVMTTTEGGKGVEKEEESFFDSSILDGEK